MNQTVIQNSSYLISRNGIYYYSRRVPATAAFFGGYPGGSGLTSGTVFGRQAGIGAATD